MLLSLIMGKGGNLVISFIECLFIIFATNKVFLNSFWFAIVLPVSPILDFEDSKNFMIIAYLIGVIFL